MAINLLQLHTQRARVTAASNLCRNYTGDLLTAMKISATHKLLIMSLLLNTVVFAYVARSLYLRGGWEYLRTSREAAGNLRLDTDTANYCHRETLFESLPSPHKRVVFLGDSLTQGCEWSEFYPEALNRGIAGDTSAGLLKRLNHIAELKPRAVFLMIGSNDLLNLHLTPGQTLANTGQAVAYIRHSSPETSIYLESNLPTWSVQKNIHSRAVNEGLRSMADGNTVIFVDLYSEFLKGALLNPAFTSDGGHLNGEGYLVWKHLIDPYMQHAIKNEGN